MLHILTALTRRLALDAFQRTLKKKQSGYLDVLAWLGAKMDVLEVKEEEMVHRLARVVSMPVV